MPFNPAKATVDANTQAIESAGDALRRTSLLPERAAEIATIDVGQTPARVVYEENKLELLHYEPMVEPEEQADTPILVVYALINRPYILDLQPDRSVVRRLLEAGHDVYLVDWNEPSRLDQELGISDYVDRYMDNCVDVVRERSGQERINVLGYCMGGTFSTMYAALYPEKLNALALLAAGLCFDDTGGVLEQWGQSEYYDPSDLTDTYGNVPAFFLDTGFALMDPMDNYVSKYVSLGENFENDDFVQNFARMEAWLGDGIDLAGRAYEEFLEKIYQENQLYRNELELNGRHVDVESIELPILQIVGEYDHLIPSEASLPFNDVVGSDDVTTIEYPSGHIGMSVSSSTHRDVWPEVSDWFHDVSGAEDVETVDGIGPTFAERLRAAGVETVADLEGYEAAELAEIAETNESRAQDWLDAL